MQLVSKGAVIKMKRIVMDIDGTITVADPQIPYSKVEPNIELIDVLREYKNRGFEIVLYTARNMNSFQNNVGKITAKTLPTLIDWLDRHSVPYDEIFVGKPWCGSEGFYVDDKAVRPDEFVKLNYDQIRKLIS